MTDLWALAVKIAEWLDAADQAGVIQRDIKPANIFVTSRQHAKILDFGLAKFTTDQADRPAPNETTVTSDHALTTPGKRYGHSRLHVAGAGPSAAARHAHRSVLVWGCA